MGRPGTAARRYADAAFELASRDDTHDAWLEGLETAVQLLGDERVAAIVDSPAVALADREALIERLLAARVAASVLNLTRVLVQRGRIDALPAVATQYRRLLNRHRGVTEAIVTSAVPLSAAETAAVRAKIESMLGLSVELASRVDDDLIGGLTVRVGDRFIDASVRGRIERLRDQLVVGAR